MIDRRRVNTITLYEFVNCLIDYNQCESLGDQLNYLFEDYSTLLDNVHNVEINAAMSFYIDIIHMGS